MRVVKKGGGEGQLRRPQQLRPTAAAATTIVPGRTSSRLEIHAMTAIAATTATLITPAAAVVGRSAGIVASVVGTAATKIAANEEIVAKAIAHAAATMRRPSLHYPRVAM